MPHALRALLLAALFSVSTLAAETIFLRSGKTIEGQVLRQDRTKVVIRTAGGIQTIPKSLIRRITYGKDAAAIQKEKEAQARKAEQERQAALRRQELERKQKEEELRKEQERKREEEERAAAAQKKSPSKSAGKESGPNSGNLFGRALRSAVLPGWGHLYSGERATAYTYATTFALSLGYAFRARQSALTAKSDFDSTVLQNKLLLTIQPSFILLTPTLDGAAREAYEAKVRRSRVAVGLVGLVYVAQLAHVMIFGGPPPGTSAQRTLLPFAFAGYESEPAGNGRTNIEVRGGISLRF